MRRRFPIILAAAGLALAGTAGFFVAAAASQDGEPTRTVTVNVGTGERGPVGPPGPPGPPGSSSCPAGFSAGNLVINHPGGQVTIRTCLKD